MKNLKLVLLNLVFALSTIVITANNLSQAQNLSDVLEGSHRGVRKVGKEENTVDLVLKKITGRDGSFLALLAEYEQPKKNKGAKAGLERISIYRVDPLKASMYDMVPLTVTLDGGIIGVNNSDPSLTLTVTGQLNGKPTLSITSANSTNKDKNIGTFVFDANNSAITAWGSIESGQYKEKNGSDKDVLMALSPEDAEFQANATLMLSDLNGQFLVEQAQPGMHVLKVVSVLSTGLKPETYPKRIGLPLVVEGREYFVLLDCESKNIVVLKKI